MVGNDVRIEQVPAQVRKHRWGPAAYAVRGESPVAMARFARALGVFQARMGEAPEPPRGSSRNAR